MTEPPAVSLDAATPADAPLLANLLELYIHDLSEAFPEVELGPDGRFGYAKLPLYWSEPERRFPFLIRADGRVAGFALAMRGSPVVDDPGVLDIAEFFVLRRYRRSGVGRQAALLLWNTLPGKWTVRVVERNPAGLAFWRETAAAAAAGTVTETVRPTDTQTWRVFAFESGAQRTDDGESAR